MTAISAPAGRRGPYWTPGMSILGGEPWVAVAETNTGHLIVPCGRDADQAVRVVRLWEAKTSAGLGIDPHRVAVGAGVVTPHGDVVDWWSHTGEPLVPLRPRWAPLRRLAAAQGCHRCQDVRWPGCWVSGDLNGCADCLPAVELADPRPAWPHEPVRPPLEVKRPTRRVRKDEADT